jgi:chorismate synthase
MDYRLAVAKKLLQKSGIEVVASVTEMGELSISLQLDRPRSAGRGLERRPRP